MSDHEYWDEVATQHDDLPDGWRRHARRAHLDLLNQWIGEPRDRWLKTDLYEERSSHRALIPALATAEWIGIDVSPEVARQAANRSTFIAVAGDVRNLPFPDASFDGILSTSTLDHFDEDDQIVVALRELCRLLAPRGRLFLTLDNPRQPLIRLRNALPRRVAERTGLVPFEVGATLDEAGGRQALLDAGFDVIATAHLLHAPHVIGTRAARWNWWERKVLPCMDRLATTRLAPWTGHYVAFLAVAP